MICRAWLPLATQIPAKLSENKAGSVARCISDSSVTPVPSRLRVCRLERSAKADTSLTWECQTTTVNNYYLKHISDKKRLHGLWLEETLVCLMLRSRSCGTQLGRTTNVASVTAVWFRLSCDRQDGADWRYSTIPASVTLVWSRDRKHRLFNPWRHRGKIFWRVKGKTHSSINTTT